MPDMTIFTAKKIITMNPSNPEATAVAVRDGRILGVGTIHELRGWGDQTLDGTFDDKVLVPGFVEAHAHAVYDALYACSVDAAYQLHMDHEVGSIEVGKRADFTVLESDPFEVEPLVLKDVPVWGTVLGGDVFEAPRG